MKQPEITWSLMHPTAIDLDYMRRVAELAKSGDVQSFEICGPCHAKGGGLDGLIDYAEYPAVAAEVDQAAVAKRIAELRELLNIAHGVDRPLYFWHREVVIEPGMRREVPELLDESGECDLLGAAFERFLRYKLEKAFAAVPELDGVVLTLTEADFSVIHNSNTEKYPPAEVVKKIAEIYAEEHRKRGKRFILRSFGSIAEDYESILAGAKAAAEKYAFEIETKITPYDFNPFLPENPFLRRTANLAFSAECDSLGEFLGAGLLPAENIENIVRYVHGAQQQGVDRYAIRMDRVGNTIFDSYPINLYAYTQAIRHPELTVEMIERNYAAEFEPASCRSELRTLGRLGLDTILHLNYVNHQLVFHSFPPSIDLKWLKAGGIFGIFKDGASPAELDGIWSILPERKNPGCTAILAEKELAVQQAEKGFAQVEALKSQLPEAEYARLRRLWHNAVIAARTMRDWSRGVAAYFADMAAGNAAAPQLEAAIRAMEADFPEFMAAANGKACTFENGLEHSLFNVRSNCAEAVYPGPMLGNLYLLRKEFAAEFAARQELQAACPQAQDCIVAGALTDDWRCGRYMHASHAFLDHDRPARLVGNTIFPNGFVRMHLAGHGGAGKLRIYGAGAFRVQINGVEHSFTIENFADLPVADTKQVCVKVFRGTGRDFPMLCAVVLLPER